jgi:vanillate O-demethylase monooxygenase subunit
VDRFVTDAWYVAAESGDVGRAPLARTLLGRPVVLYRTGVGAPVALEDACPHKLAPLSGGTLRGDAIECGYHGLTFDPRGECVRAPGARTIPANACVPSLPAADHLGFVWVWTGDPAAAAPEKLPQVADYGRQGWTIGRGAPMRFAARWWLLAENLIDPAHTSFVHRSTVGGASGEDAPLRLERGSGDVCFGRWIEKSEPVPVMRTLGGVSGPVDRWQTYAFTAPQTGTVDFGAIAHGAPHTEAAMDAGFRIRTVMFITPETARSTRYYWFQMRNFAPGDDGVTASLLASYAHTFEEDRMLLEAIQTNEDALGVRRTVRLPIDAGGVRLARVMAALAASPAQRVPPREAA